MQCKDLIKKGISHPCFSKFKYDTSKLVTFLTNHNRKDFSLLFSQLSFPQNSGWSIQIS